MLDPGDNRVRTVTWQSDSLIFTNGDACIPRRDTLVRSCARLLAVNTSTGIVTIDKDRSKRGQHFFYPAARPNVNGTIVLGYGRSSASVFPELDVTATSPDGAFARWKTIQTGDAPNETTRYGDYFAVAIDPSAPSNARIAGEIGGHNKLGSKGWATAIAQVFVSP